MSTGHDPQGLASRYNSFVETHEVAWELVMGALAAAFVAVGVAHDAAADAGADTTMLAALDIGLWSIFALEFGTRLYAAPSRSTYLRGHWIDAVALIPAARTVRLFRLVRLLRLVRAFTGVFRALDSIEHFAAHRHLIALFIAWLAVAVISGTAFYFSEVGTNSNIGSPVDALWWAVVTLTTVGYGDVFPVTPEGRLAGAALMIIGITLWAAITGTITSLLISSQHGDVGIPEQIRQLDDLRRDAILSDEEFQAKKTDLLARM